MKNLNSEVSSSLRVFRLLKQNLREIIQPIRKEYLICWWILHMIKQDKVISNFLFDKKSFDKIAYPTFQCDIESKTFDISFDYLDIVIEIQENNVSHKNNPNDRLKESIVKFKTKRIKYFKLKDFEQRNHDYLDYFWNDI